MTAAELLDVEAAGGPAVLADSLAARVLRPPRWTAWALLPLGALTIWFFGAIAYTVITGIGVWGNDIPVAWAFAITNFVWWIGIGHAGTFISAILLLLEQKWRTSINRITEAMTLFAVMQAGLFPLLHLGRPWFFYWLVPYPSEMRVWPQFRSALTWDVAAVFTYFTISLLFWYLGLVPDLALIRDRATRIWRRRIYGVFSLGFTGNAQQWHRFRIAYGLLAGLATPLVISVHSVVSSDFAIAIQPAWHSTIYPPYFVAGAIYSGFAMVVMLIVPMRRLYKLHAVITDQHLNALGLMLLATGSIVLYSYATEAYTTYLSGDVVDHWTQFEYRFRGDGAPFYWTIVFCNGVQVQLLWWRRARTSAMTLFVVSCFAQVGMWLERFELIRAALAQDFLPSSWGTYRPSFVDLSLLGGSIGFFLFLFVLFLRYVPFIPIRELLELRDEAAKEKLAEVPA
ncbi:MAG TPA: NrfD/PsrC family molybdoenzyme membrane anchor subunit [Labilithrix sp.]|jgi:molybdopterin-containing oxidoreductase family membrane subunit